MNICIGGDLDGRVIVLDKPCFNAKKVNKTKAANEPYRVCRRVNILRDYPDDKIKIYP